MDEVYLNQLKEYLPKYPHIENSLSFEEWEEGGKPHIWVHKVYSNNAVGMLDEGHGYIALFEDSKLVGLEYSKPMVLGKEYLLLYEEDLILFKKVAFEEVLKK